MIDYKEAKKKISIISILRDWGYNHQHTKGLGLQVRQVEGKNQSKLRAARRTR